MPTAALVLFALTATVGVFMATLHLRNKRPALALAVAHVFMAVVGLAALVRSELPRLGVYSAITFGAAAVGGGILLLPARLRGVMPKKLFVVAHALMAASAFILLLLAVFG